MPKTMNKDGAVTPRSVKRDGALRNLANMSDFGKAKMAVGTSKSAARQRVINGMAAAGELRATRAAVADKKAKADAATKASLGRKTQSMR